MADLHEQMRVPRIPRGSEARGARKEGDLWWSDVLSFSCYVSWFLVLLLSLFLYFVHSCLYIYICGVLSSSSLVSRGTYLYWATWFTVSREQTWRRQELLVYSMNMPTALHIGNIIAMSLTLVYLQFTFGACTSWTQSPQ